MNHVSVSVGQTLDRAGNPGFNLKLQGQDWELNIVLNPKDTTLISCVRNARWTERESLRIGSCGGVPTFWSAQDGLVSVLTGHDDETWDFGVWIPESAINEILEEIEKAKQEQ